MGRSENAGLEKADIRFIRRCMARPLLSREREQALALAWRDRHDQGALHELILAYARQVIAAAGRLRGYGLPLGDLIQEGNIGLMEAATRFDPGRGVRFSTYAAWWVRAAMQDHVLRNWSIVRTGTTLAQKALFFNLRRLRARLADPTRLTMSEDEIDKIAGALGVRRAEVVAMERCLAGGAFSLNAIFGEQGEDSWQDLLPDERPTPEEAVAAAHDEFRRRQWLGRALSRLPARERRILQARHLTGGAITLEELGAELGVSKERVRQLEQRALKRVATDVLAQAAGDSLTPAGVP